jgi:hypothetical protein
MKIIEEYKTGSLFIVLRENTKTGFFEVWTGDDTIDYGTDGQLGDLIDGDCFPICEAQEIFDDLVGDIRERLVPIFAVNARRSQNGMA